MSPKSMKTLHAPTPDEWRNWLAAHHDSEPDVWLVFHKRHTGQPAIAYEDAVNEALCFGWIDSLIRRLDDARYARKFTPRKPESRWSALNRKRYAKLRKEGRLTAAGLNRAPTPRGDVGQRPRRWSRVPRYIREALERRPAALAHFENLAPGYRRLYVGWIDSAKKEETKLRRLDEAIRLLAAGKKLGLK